MDERLLDEAIAWQRNLAGSDADWDGFTAWLEADPSHRHAFDAISLVERMVDDRREDLRRLLPAASDEAHEAVPRRRLVLAGSIAAALALAVGVQLGWPGRQDTVYATTSGETRRIALAGGAAVALAPASRLVVKGGDVTALKLERGEAFFDIRHDPRRSLSIEAGSYAITDIGTKFGVTLGESTVRVAVSEGHVAVAGDNGVTPVAAGEQLIAMADGSAEKSNVALGDVGSWQLGRLTYRDTPLSIVVADIARYSGQKISLEPTLRNKRFSGVLAIGDGSDLLASLASLMALSWRVEGDHLRVIAGSAH